MKNSILFMIHCEQNTGYAIEKLEAVFLAAAINAGYEKNNIHWSYSKVKNPSVNIHELDFHNENIDIQFKKLLQKYRFDIVFAFDLPFPSNIVPLAKAQGVNKVISYWGASMSDLNKGIKLALKKLEHRLNRHKSADLYIFESKAMQLTATHGRGIPMERTCVIPLGVDTEEYFPSNDKSYIHEKLNIPDNRKVIFYSGHMEERKGVRVIVKAAIELAKLNKIENLHFVLCGNKGSEADTYLNDLVNSPALNYVTFAGYRDDLPELMRTSHIGVIASTGWDSFTRSSIEMLASGLPLIASDLGGLAETTINNETGYLVSPGSHIDLTNAIIKLTQKIQLYNNFSRNARSRAVSNFSQNEQVKSITTLMSL